MMSLFNSFDLYFYSFSFILIMTLSLNLFSKIMKIDLFSIVKIEVALNLMNFFFSLKMNSFTKFFVSILATLFSFLFMVNFSSVLCFNFALCSQVSLILFVGMTVWLSFMMFSLMNSFKGFLSHCVPEGTPMYLVWFLFIIELISNSIRPITITVRLVANILAGHLLMILLSKLVFSYFFFMLIYLILNTVEIFVALIQSYIFVTMITLYYSDVN